jgi:integrase
LGGAVVSAPKGPHVNALTAPAPPFVPATSVLDGPTGAVAPAPMTYGMVVKAVDQASNLTSGVRQNLRAVVYRCADLMSPAGLLAEVDVSAIRERLEELSPVHLAFTHPGSLAAFKSNLWRALRLAGLTVPYARHTAPLLQSWAALQAKITDLSMRRKLSRFIHLASARGCSPSDVTDEHIREFRSHLGETCLKSKVAKVIRNTVREWNRAVENIEGWPARRLNVGAVDKWHYALPWSAFPQGFRDEVETFVGRQELDWLEPTAGQPLRPQTRANYRNALRRAASILVDLGTPPDSISSLREVVEPSRVRLVLEFLRERTGRTRGGHVAYMALLLYLAARDYVHAHDSNLQPVKAKLERLQKFVANTAETKRGMSDRTWRRLLQFDDPVVLERVKNFHFELLESVKDQPITVETAKTVRLALLLALCFDNGLRSGNVVAIDLDRHVVRQETSDTVHLVISPDEIKNKQGFNGPLRASTVAIWRLYLEKYRAAHMGKPCSWLFPRQGGSHWTQHNAYMDVTDVCDKLLGLDVTPHLIRALIGKIILDQYPGGHAIVQQVLGHKQLATTVGFYAPIRQTTARSILHEILEDGSKHRIGAT